MLDHNAVEPVHSDSNEKVMSMHIAHNGSSSDGGGMKD